MKLQTMNQADVEAYVATLAKDDSSLTGMEAQMAKKLREASVKQRQIQQRIDQIRNEEGQLGNELQMLAGESRGLMELLVAAEDSRRTAAKAQAAEGAKQKTEQPEATPSE